MTPIKVCLLISLFLLQLQCSGSASANPDQPQPLQFIPDHGSTGGGTPGAFQTSSLLKVLSSKLDNPSQSSLDLMLKKVDRVRVLAGGESNGKPLNKKVLLDSRKPELLSALKESLRIDEDPENLGHDMCLGDPTIELLSGKKRLAVLGFHHARAIRWDRAWKFDAPLKDGRRLVDWFALNGIEGPRLDLEAEVKEKRRSSADLQKWTMATPDCLRPYLGALLSPAMTDVLVFLPEPSPADELRSAEPLSSHESPGQKQLMSVLDANFQDQHDKILALLQWYASGMGPWTGFPTYEELPAELLLGFPTEVIIEGLNSKNVSEPELEGAARYFASHTFRVAKPRDLALLDAKLRKRLLEHCLKSDDADKRKRAENAFAASGYLESADNRSH